MIISEASLSSVKDFCGVTGDDSDELLTALMAAAKAKLIADTSMTEDELDEHEDLTAAYLVMINELFIARTVTIEDGKPNPFVEQIVNAHHANYVG